MMDSSSTTRPPITSSCQSDPRSPAGSDSEAVKATRSAALKRAIPASSPGLARAALLADAPKVLLWPQVLFDDHSFALGWGRRCRRRDREGEPCVPALRPVRGVEFLVAFQIQIALMFRSNWKDITDLRSDADHS